MCWITWRIKRRKGRKENSVWMGWWKMGLDLDISSTVGAIPKEITVHKIMFGL